jgi:glycosyltransferase involved in cell wall biosynthesis
VTSLIHKINPETADSMQSQPKILFVTSHWPLAEAYGAQQRVLNLGKLLSRFGAVSFVIAPTEHEDEETVLRTRRQFEVCGIFRPLPRAKGNFIVQLPQRLRHEFDPACMATDPYEMSQADRAALQELIDQHDVVWVHTIRTANWFRIYRWRHSILDIDDLPSQQYQSAARSNGSPLRRFLNLRMSRIWQRRERVFANRFDVLAVCSEDDRKCVANTSHVHVIPNGSYPIEPTRTPASDLQRIGLIGNCTFKPNEDGVKWFIRDVWPLIKHQFPRAQLRLVGRGSEGHLAKSGPDITGLGWLEDPKEEISSWSAMIVPIKTGAGTRVKVAEGFARKCPVIATTMGIFGYDVENGREALLADRAHDFASACIRLLRDPKFGEALAERAHQRFLKQWTWNSFENTVGKAVYECLAKSDRPQSARVDAYAMPKVQVE